MNTSNFRKFIGIASFLLLGGVASAAENDLITIEHDAIGSISVGEPVKISLAINDPHGEIEMVRTYFKTTQDNRFYFVTMKKTEGNIYTGVLPAPLYGAKSLKYQVLAKSTSDQIVKTPRYVAVVEKKRAIAYLE